MLLAEQLMEDMKASMLAADARRTGVLRLLRSALKNEQIKVGHELSDDEALKVLQREAKQRRDSIDQYTQGGRQDLADQEEYELGIIGSYLPQPLSEDELRDIVERAVAETGATSMAQMGQVIGAVMKAAGARADGGAVSRLVKEQLSA
jgi:uncharacterized protein YqeY